MKKNYIPASMSFAEGFMGPKGGSIERFMVVDEKKAKQIIKKLLKEKRNIDTAELGLDGDWIQNNSIIYDGKYYKYEAYEGSMWATPILIVNFTDAPSETYDCYRIEDRSED